VETLPVPHQQLIEIAKALGPGADRPRPRRADLRLGPVESSAVLRCARELADSGAVVVFIGHRLDEVRDIADRVVVLRNGRLAADLTPAEATEARLIREMVGAELSDLVGEPRATVQPGRCSPRPVWVGWPRPRGPDCARREILGVAGLMGSGRSRLLHTIMAAQPRSAAR